ncbi:hypothetical protein ACFWRT_33075 [Streptomyces cyaneofuscatus]|uniref:hypothetical protein n=1 Tax=Streptomyces cyaneofuscatus TaxID=66883 RepID=UPI003659208C
MHVGDRLLVKETKDGTCPGYSAPCGRPVVSAGLCLHHVDLFVMNRLSHSGWYDSAARRGDAFA